MRVTKVEVWIVEVPQKWPIAPYRSHLRTSSTTQSGIVALTTEDGLVGWGEYNVNFLPNLSAARDQKLASDWLTGHDAGNIADFHRTCPLDTRLKSGLEIALWDLLGQAAGVPVAQLLGGVLRPEIELAACMGIQPYTASGDLARHYVEQGYTTLKTKAGSDMNEDLEMVRGVRDAVGDRLKLRIDPNRAYSLEQGKELARRLEEYGLEYLEQPIPAEPLETARELRESTRTPIALNESVIGPDSVWEILHQEAAAFILPDTHIAGGILPCVKIGHLCEAAGIPSIMHCGHDLGPKTAAMLHVAAASPAYSLANDSTYYGLVEDITCVPLTIRAGWMAVPLTPGLGVAGDRDLLRKYSLPG